jgi:signal transduction histidine kinase
MTDGIDLRMDLADKELVVMVDSLKIKEAIFKLVENAMEAMPSGGVLTLRSKEVFFNKAPRRTKEDYLYGACALVSIADTGFGMDAGTLERIYEPFFTTKEGRNRGLGFSMASRIIGDHHGIISIESAPDKGTVINIYIPLMKKNILQIFPIPLPSSFADFENRFRNELFGSKNLFK